MQLEDQRQFWNRWNAETRALQLTEISRRQAEVVTGWLSRLGRRQLDLIEVGCGAAWFTPALGQFGKVTATDLSDELLAKAQLKQADVRFVAGDFMTLEFDRAGFDVAVCLEVLSHVADQPAFLARISDLLRPGGHLMLATQNRPVLQRYNRIPPPAHGQLRRWVDKDELHALLAPRFDVQEIAAVTPMADHGLPRLLASHKLNRAIALLVGNAYRNLLERYGFGWTLMALARKR
ncbi:MAG: class I SAM-dependent methyltransferase [Hyphomicrobiaceae bacterium]|nr:class I SAM-dependent methyltransferase [Hyphomicrobiaceae bacterium]